MAQFKYTALSPNGEKVSGMITGFNELDAAARIKESCSVILNIKEVSEKQAVGLLNFDLTANKLNSKAFTVMCSQFAIILESGVPVSRACHLIADKTTDKNLKNMLVKVAEDVEGGRTLSAAFEDHGGKLLPATFVETIRAGEESGNIDRSFSTMEAHFDKQVKTKAKVRGAMAYPLFVIVIAIAAVAVIMIKVVPTFTGIFAESGGEIPAMMASLIAVSNFFRKYILVIIAVIAAVILGLKLYGNSEKGRINLAKLALRLPVLGNINLLTAASQFANSMTTLRSSGLPIPKAVAITAKVIDNYYISTEVGKLTGQLEAGRTLGASMREQKVLPDILVDMTAVGEETGELAQTLGTIAKFYDSELNNAVQAALAKLEPGMLIFIAIFAGYIVIAVYTGMFQMYGSMA